MAHPSQLKSRIVAILDSRMRRKQTTRLSTAALLTATALLTVGLGSIQFTRLAAIPLPMLPTPIPAPALTPKAPSPSIAKPAQGPAQELRYAVKRATISYPVEAGPVAGTAQISGRTVDASTFPIPGVIIAATNTETGITITTVTDQNGVYTFRNLSQGRYRLDARLSGLQNRSYDDVRLDDAQQVRLNFQLQPGQ